MEEVMNKKKIAAGVVASAVSLFMLCGCSAADGVKALLHSGVSDVTPTSAPVTSQNDTQQDNTIKYYMYVANCKQSVTLRSEPDANSSDMMQIPYGSPVGVVDTGANGFYRVSYNGQTGYVSSAYLSNVPPPAKPVQPQPVQPQDNSSYAAVVSPAEVEAFVDSSLRAFVNGINTGDTTYISWYFTGDEASQERKTHDQIVKSVTNEEIISLNCHSGKILSADKATAVRDSVIRVTYDDGRVKDITEKYLYTVQISGDGSMRITDLEEL